MVTIWFRRSSQKAALGCVFKVEPQYDEDWSEGVRERDE